MSAKDIYPVIMAGGRGTRFWPASIRRRPKQFMELLPGGTMLQITARRFRNIADPGNVIVVTGSEHGATVLEQLPLLDRSNLLLEPSGRNTAPCIGWAAETIVRRGNPDAVMVVAASDHMIEPLEGFQDTVQTAITLAEDGFLCTVGIVPEYPATGYGYLQKGESVSAGYRVKTFREKPDAATASDYLSSGDFLWNSGMFIWRASVFLEELDKFMPELRSALRELPDTTTPPEAIYNSLPSVSVDYGVMEHTSKAALVPAGFRWSDIGDWPGARKAGVTRGRHLLVDSDNALVFDETGRLTVVVGVSDVSVVSTDAVTLVMADSSSQKIKDVVQRLDSQDPSLT